MIDYVKVRIACGECDGETIVMFEDIYGQQYEITYCPFCGDDNITIEEEDENIPRI